MSSTEVTIFAHQPRRANRLSSATRQHILFFHNQNEKIYNQLRKFSPLPRLSHHKFFQEMIDKTRQKSDTGSQQIHMKGKFERQINLDLDNLHGYTTSWSGYQETRGYLKVAPILNPSSHSLRFACSINAESHSTDIAKKT